MRQSAPGRAVGARGAQEALAGAHPQLESLEHAIAVRLCNVIRRT